MSLRILVTGSSGFIGSRLVKRLRQDHIPVIGVDIKKAPTTDFILDLSDTSKSDFLGSLMKDQDITHVIHLAALIRVDEGEKEPLEYWNANVKGTYTVLKAMNMIEHQPKLIFASSAAVYSSEKDNFKLDTSSPLGPSTVYGRSKLEAEKLIRGWDRLDYLILRLFNVAGGKEDPPYHLIPKTFERLYKGEPPVIYGDGSAVRSFVHVQDVIKVILTAIRKDTRKIYNVAHGTWFSVWDVVHAVRKVWQEKTPFIASLPQKLSPRPNDPLILVSSPYTKFACEIPLNRMIEDTFREMFPDYVRKYKWPD